MTRRLVKVCGLTTPETVDAAVDAGADYIGLNLYPPSPRYVPVDQAVKLRMRIPPTTKVVLLLVNEQPIPTAQMVDAVKPDVVQFHGGETAQWLGMLKGAVKEEIWKAIGVKSADSLKNALRFKGAAHRLLYDAAPGVLPGGNGVAIDWTLLAGFCHEIPWGLAGGLTPDNVGEAVRISGAELLDASSGLESAPGVKDVGKIRAFIEAVRAA
ncbi:N-(5'-phosphoribosyl)anthranilate isomerase [Tsuneonella dongtanensis]|uniref:N-(5'-phosphoribosyl)anthranilate isomerase n=1 Tax=Tsuneonella dongtanensis TaxID=692370 RepID=A0A1B2ACM1_9SPHN|nr:phosphoribosylanthranilate isomerase [Tsuneonella dongtanensis]ANY19910.1 N-(5'-phosphoribosyl)anthranilate isomerase [Tsuneonella dongtanensis]